jgi:hypothetical protein
MVMAGWQIRNQFKDVLIAETMIDSLGQIFSLAWGTALIENSTNWNWFALILKQTLKTTADAALKIFSYREKG